MTDIETIVINCIKTVLRNENYTENRIISVLNYNWAELKEVIERCTIKEE